jgi:predicted nucleotide-binding protein (sugar kinase/HSP70/actin superfamily)
MEECMKDLCDHLREYKSPELVNAVPGIFRPIVRNCDKLRLIGSIFYKMHIYLKGKEFSAALARCRKRIDGIAVDRTRLKPVVKIVGEFWAQTTEGGGNYRMFEFLEKEGAHVQPEAIGTWLAYLMAHARMQLYPKRGMNANCEEPDRLAFGQKFRNELAFQKKRLMLSFGEWFYARLYHRIVRDMGGIAHTLIPQEELAELARPFFKPLARGGEGYLEVGKNIYYHSRKLTHMVLGLKPFGCLPSSQSDGVQSAVVGKHKDIIYLPIETSGEGEVNAHSRVQMALGEAKAKAKAEFQAALASTGKTLEQIRAFASRHPDLNRPLYKTPHYPGVAGVAANFVLHVNELMGENP